MSHGIYTLSSVSSCNVSYKREIDAETLIGILSGTMPLEGWKSHIETFFNELPDVYILGVMEENNLRIEQLINIFEQLPDIFQEKNFKTIVAKYNQEK